MRIMYWTNTKKEDWRRVNGVTSMHPDMKNNRMVYIKNNGEVCVGKDAIALDLIIQIDED